MIRSLIRERVQFLSPGSNLGGLETRSRLRCFQPGNQSVWETRPRRHSQVISPGRSGTRWLANVLLDASDCLVCHASARTLSEVGFLYHNGSINADEALGAYRFSRGLFLGIAEKEDRAYIDLDCKNSPLALPLSQSYPECKFIVLLRDPISFIKSGLNRGYFVEKHPQAWGHLYRGDMLQWRAISEADQIYKIAAFWNSVALVAHDLFLRVPERVHVVSVSNMFEDPLVVQKIMSWLGIDGRSPIDCRTFKNKANLSRSKLCISNIQASVLGSDQLRASCFDGLNSEFLGQLGF